MKKFNYYTAPSQAIFNDIKKNALKIWEGYDDTYGYRTEKTERVKGIKNISDNVWCIVAMFDPINQAKLISMVKPKTASLIIQAIGGAES